MLQNDSRPDSSLTINSNSSQFESDAPNPATPPTTTQRSRSMKRNANTLDKTLTNEVLLTVQDHFKRPVQQDDRFDIFSKNVVMKLRDVTKE